jgi:hypothetical protein
VVRLGYSRVIGVAAKLTDKKENSGNHGRVNRVSQNSNMDRQADQLGRVSRVGRITRVSPSSCMDRRTNQASRVGGTEQKIGGSNHVANTKVQVMENSVNMESWVIENLANTESRATENSAYTES